MKGKWYIVTLSFILGYLPIVIGFLSFLLLLILFNKKMLKNRLLFISSLIFFLLSQIISPNINMISNIERDTVEGWITVKTNPDANQNQIRFIGEFKEQDIYFFTEQESSSLGYGSKCYVKATLERPRQATNPGSFDYRKYLATQGVYLVSYDAEISHCQNQSILVHVFNMREKLMLLAEESLQDDTVMWINALLFGERSKINEELIEAFQFWGLSHLLAISGLHVGIVLSGLYLLLLKVFKFTKEQSKWTIIFIIPLYIIIAGSQPPVIRAGLMAVCFLLWSMFKQKKTDSTDVISAVMLGMLLFNPYLLYQMSFQFSFAVTLALILSKNLLLNHDHWMVLSIKVSLISQLVILPLQLYYFYYTNVFSFLLNLIYVPYFTLIVMPFLFLIIVTSILPFPLNQMLESLFNSIHDIFMNLLIELGEPQHAIWVLGKPHLLVMLLYFFLFVLMMVYWDQRKLNRAGWFGVGLIAICYVGAFIQHFTPNYTITMLDVGQAESIIIELPYRQGVFMVDAGEELNNESHDNFMHVIKPYLWSKGITNIDALWISHFDYDHSASIKQVIHQFKPKQLITGPTEETYKYRNLEHLKVYEGYILNYRGANFNVLSPNNTITDLSSNDQSLVFILEYAEHKMMFTGDISEEVERQIISKHKLQPIDVLKVAHHGSQSSTSESWLDRIAPDIAIISVGQFNYYGHPHQSVIETLKQRGIRTFRTDQHGAIIIKYKDGQSTINQYSP